MQIVIVKNTSDLDRYNIMKPINPVNILLLISDLEGSCHHLGENGFDEDKKVVREICNRYYKMYFKLCKEQGRNPY